MSYLWKTEEALEMLDRMVDRVADVVAGGSPEPLAEGEQAVLVSSRKRAKLLAQDGNRIHSDFLHLTEIDWALAVLTHEDLDWEGVRTLFGNLDDDAIQTLAVAKAILGHPATDDTLGVRYVASAWPKGVHHSRLVVKWIRRNAQPATRVAAAMFLTSAVYVHGIVNGRVENIPHRVGALGNEAVDTFEQLLREMLESVEPADFGLVEYLAAEQACAAVETLYS